MATVAHSAESIERLARRRVKAKMGWYLHAAIFVVVNLFLAALSLFMGKHWHLFPLFGWGLGLSIHGTAVWLRCTDWGSQFQDRMMARERASLTLAQQG